MLVSQISASQSTTDSVVMIMTKTDGQMHNDDCSSNDGTSWWGQLGCSDDDQDGWVDDAHSWRQIPKNWKQAIDSDRDTFGDNHGPDCCNVTEKSLHQ